MTGEVLLALGLALLFLASAAASEVCRDYRWQCMRWRRGQRTSEPVRPSVTVRFFGALMQ